MANNTDEEKKGEVSDGEIIKKHLCYENTNRFCDKQ